MPIESEIPLEIDAYRKKIFLGMSLRQLICLAMAVVFAGGIFYLCVFILHFSIDNAGWAVMLMVCPLMAIGFIRPDGDPFEKYLARKLRRYLWCNRLCYTANPAPFDAEATADRGKSKQKGGIRYAPDPTARAAENTYSFRPGTGRKGKRKQTALRIKAAQKEFRHAAARAKQTAHGAARA